MGLTRLREIHLALESSPADGTAPDRTNSGTDVIARTRNIQVQIDNLQVTRDLSRSSLTNAPKLNPGQTQVTVTFEVELAGHPDNPDVTAGSLFTEPLWGKLITIGGFKPVYAPSYEVPLAGAVTNGPFLDGEVVAAGGTGIVVGACYNGYPNLFVRSLSGTLTGTITGATSGATASITGSVSSAGSVRVGTHGLNSDRTAASTSGAMDIYFDGKRLSLVGCRSDLNFNWQHAEPGRIQATVFGVFDEYVDDAAPTATDNDLQLKPPLFFNDGAGQLDLILQSNDGAESYTGSECSLTNLSLGLGNTVTARSNSCSTTGTGLNAAEITARAPVGSMNPDEVDNTEFNFVAGLRAGTEYNLRVQLGSTQGNRYAFVAPSIVFSGLGDTDREGVHAWDLTFDITGGDRSDGSVGSDNELVLLDW